MKTKKMTELLLAPRMWAKHKGSNLWDILHKRAEQSDQFDRWPYYLPRVQFWGKDEVVDLIHYDHFRVHPMDLKEIEDTNNDKSV